MILSRPIKFDAQEKSSKKVQSPFKLHKNSIKLFKGPKVASSVGPYMYAVAIDDGLYDSWS